MLCAMIYVRASMMEQIFWLSLVELLIASAGENKSAVSAKMLQLNKHPVFQSSHLLDSCLSNESWLAERAMTEIASEYSFRKSLREAFRFITSSPHKPVVFYRTWTPSHFENGEWFSGGTCNRTVPFKPGEAGDRESDTRMWRIEGEEFAKAVADDGPSNAGRLKLLDTFELSLLRPDGHPGPYRTYHPFGKGGAAKVQNDCLHWCLPGPIDAWNDVIMQMSAKDDVGEGLKRPRAQA